MRVCSGVTEVDEFPRRGLDCVQKPVAVGVGIGGVCARIESTDEDTSIGLHAIDQAIFVRVRVGRISPNDEFLQVC